MSYFSASDMRFLFCFQISLNLKKFLNLEKRVSWSFSVLMPVSEITRAAFNLAVTLVLVWEPCDVCEQAFVPEK